MNNYLVVPAYYEGTSFEDLFLELVYVFESSNIHVEIIGQTLPLQNNLPYDVLDDNSFFYIQTNIANELISKIKSPARILFIDFFFPSLDLIKYFFSKNKIEAKLGALLHGGLFLEDDLFQNENWMKYFEYGYFDIFDVVYAPSQHLKKNAPIEFQNKIKVFNWGLEYFYKELSTKKASTQFDVIFPHRITEDKGISDFIYIVENFPTTKFCITLPQVVNSQITSDYLENLKSHKNMAIVAGENRQDHIQTLTASKIVLSCAKQENFGYAIHKAVLSGCIPVLPDRLCYPEFFEDKYLYKNLDEAIQMIKKYLNDDKRNNIMNLNKKVHSFKNLVRDFFGEKNGRRK